MTTAKKSTTTRDKKPTTKAKVVKASQSIPDLPNNPFVYEIFEVVAKQRTIAKKVEALKSSSILA